jgi:hypothetical protein
MRLRARICCIYALFDLVTAIMRRLERSCNGKASSFFLPTISTMPIENLVVLLVLHAVKLVFAGCCLTPHENIRMHHP